MLFWIRHDSLYRYDVPVSLGPHLVRLTPRLATGGADQLRLRERRLHVEPEPIARWEERDEHGNSLTRVSFAGSSQVLRVLSELALETLPEPPPVLASAPLPWAPLGGALVDPAVQQFAESLARDELSSTISGTPRSCEYTIEAF